MKKHSSNGRLFDVVHSDLKIEWEGYCATVPDNQRTAAARESWERDKTFENAMEFAQALCYQLRYKECLGFCEQLLGLFGTEYALVRRLGVLNFKLLKFDTSKYYLKKCLAKTDERLYILYMLGAVCYYNCEYEESRYYFMQCFPLCADNGEMHVAALFWYLCCILRTSNSTGKAEEYFGKYNRDCGHHTGYDIFVRFAMGEIDESEAAQIAITESELNRTCFYYGMSVFFTNDEKKSKEYLNKTLALSDYFGGYAYIAAYADFLKHNRS